MLITDGPSFLLHLPTFTSGHQSLTKHRTKPWGGLVTKVSFLIPKGLIQLMRQGSAKSECSEHPVLPETEDTVTEWPNKHILSADAALRRMYLISYSHQESEENLKSLHMLRWRNTSMLTRYRGQFPREDGDPLSQGLRLCKQTKPNLCQPVGANAESE